MRSSGVGTGTTGLVHCGVDKRLVPGEKAATPTVLYLGRLKAHKRVDLLIETFARVRERVPGAVLEIAGTGDARPSLEALAKRLGLEDAVRFEGFVDDDRKRELLQRAWVTATLSEIEGWGISPIEGNACGTPAIAYDVPGLREAIVHGESGLIVPIGGDVSDAIVSVLQDDALRARLQRGALRRAELFSWDKSARDMFLEIMRAIVGIDVRSVDLDGNWTYFRSNSPAAAEVSSLVDTRWVR
jgi:glycosyltransferase involved in cell wall biosynthesis